jgi:Cu+-exporting ATPase
VIGVWDVVRSEAAGVLEELRRSGLEQQALLTGDRRAAAQAVAERLGLATVQFELTPVQKAEFLKGWQAAGRRVAMVGDGVNDAPALAQADVGLALGGTGADIAAEAGDIVFMGDPLRPLPLLVRLARQTHAILRQNLFIFAVGVNVVGFLLTAWILPLWSEAARQQAPFWAAVYHQIGSLGVLLNAMRLLWFERERDSAWLRAASSVTRQIDAFLEQFSPHEASHWIMDHARYSAGIALAGLLTIWLALGFWAIPEGAVGVVQRLGQTLPDDLAPGLHWRWPWPVERVHVVAVDQLRPVAVGFRWLPQRDATAATWAALHPSVAAREREEALMITGDGSLLEVQFVLWYRINNVRAYLFETADPEPVLQALAEGVVRDVLAGQSFLAVLSERRGAFEHEVLSRLQARLAEPPHARLGVTLQSLAFQDLHPPREVVEAYYQVTRALARRSQVVTAAQIERDNRRVQELIARGRLLAQAQGRADEMHRRVRAEVAAFSQFAAAHVVAGALSTAATAQPLAALDVALTEFRLTVEMCEQTFPGRPKILRDPALPGHLHLMPELLRLRLPNLPRERPVAPEER